MTLIPTMPRQSTGLSALVHRRHGWIGIDVGSAAAKIVQLTNCGGQLEINASWLIDDYPSPANLRQALCAGALPFELRKTVIASVFKGRSAAVTLPMSLVQQRAMELPSGSDDELRNMIHEELQAEHTDRTELSFDYLEAPSADTSESELTSLSVFAVPQEIAMGTGRALAACGLDCQILDSLPCALARAAKLCEPTQCELPIAVIDIGESTAILVVAVDGQLLFMRQLRGCSANAITKPLQDGLGLSKSEARQLLEQHDQAYVNGRVAMASLAHTATQMLDEPLSQFSAEVKRTLDFVDLQYRPIAPKQLILHGGGALLPGVCESLANEIGLPARLWAMSPRNGTSPPREQALFGVAAALSSLSWEAAACT